MMDGFLAQGLSSRPNPLLLIAKTPSRQVAKNTRNNKKREIGMNENKGFPPFLPVLLRGFAALRLCVQNNACETRQWTRRGTEPLVARPTVLKWTG